MRRYVRTVRHCVLAALAIAASMAVATSGAQATVIDTSAFGKASVPYNPAGQESYLGVDIVPLQRYDGTLPSAKVGVVTSTAPCLDPALTADLNGPFLPLGGICSHGGPVMHKNETFAVTWDPLRRYFATTRNYVEQYLRDVADGRGTFTSPYAVTPQYTDSTGRANYDSLYGGACIDFGVVGRSACQFGSTSGTSPGHDYPATNSCTPTGTNMRWGPDFTQHPNDVCVIDTDVKNEVKQMASQTGMLSHVKPGYTPLVVLLTPPGVVTCIDGGATPKLCSANSNTRAQDDQNGTPCGNVGFLSPCSLPNVAARFCSYHGQVQMDDGSELQYVVQPWTAETTAYGGCDEYEPDVDPIPTPVDVQLLGKYIGERLVSPLSQAQIEAEVNPAMNGWFALNGSEIGDWNNVGLESACIPRPKQLDKSTVGASGQNPYYLQREFNNAGLIETDPNALACTGWVNYQPRFVIPSAVNQTDVVEFDGSTTISTLMVPNAGYFWDFGDGHTAVGASVVHSYAKAGTYAVKLTTVDRGGNVASVSQGIIVLDQNGQPVNTGGGGGGGGGSSSVLQVRLQLVPQGLKSMLRSGVAMKVTSNKAASGIVTVSITRGAAREAHIRTGHGPSVVIGRGTVSKIKSGTMQLRLHLSRSVAAKLKRLRHVTLTIRVALVDGNGVHRAFVAAGRY
jgi:PKD domain